MTTHAVKQDETALLASATPMMRQYLSIKEQHHDALLFYRMGDFYELFFDDAVTAAQVLDITLTRRGKHDDNDIPMCGVPFHSYEPYLQKLIKAGHRVAICEQMEPPEEAKKRGAKSVVRREVVRIITPGTITEDNLLDARSSNYLCALAEAQGKLAIAWVDISTGEFRIGALHRDGLSNELSRLNPKEILIPEKFLEDKAIAAQLQDWKPLLTSHVNSFFDTGRAEKRIQDFYGLNSIEVMGFTQRAEIAAAGALIEYVALTQKGQKPRLEMPKPFLAQDYMAIDPSTRRNLELTCTTHGEYKGSLMSVIDRTATAPGGRLLYFMVTHPLVQADAINSRLDTVEFFLSQPEVRERLRASLKRLPDMERALSRLSVGRGGPRDLAALREGLYESRLVAEVLEHLNVDHVPAGLAALTRQIGSYDELIALLQHGLKDEVPFLARDGNFVREGFDPRLDMARNAREESETAKLALRDQYRELTGIDKLKVLDNNVLGFFIEVTAQQSSKIPVEFIHRQTMANAVRYTTPELRELENRVIHAKENSLSLELEIYAALVNAVLAKADDISLTAQALASLDVFSAFALLAGEQHHVRPKVDMGDSFTISKGRHPVVEHALARRNDFIGNDCVLSDESKLWLLTGPNMAGKSTFLRQNALIIVMAQMGAFVPAASAHIGVVDRLFSRVGAADDLARGRSTFMVEMIETATILNQATARSFVILDEIGRGTATFDGLSIAWAVIEYLHNVTKSRTLFATHYHELTSLTQKLPHIACHTMKVKEWQGDVVFLHEVVAGNADRSYGIHVAKLAGLPQAVVDRAREVLGTLEQGSQGASVNRLAEALPLFTQPQEKPKAESDLAKKLKSIELDNLTPKEALETLYALKDELDD